MKKFITILLTIALIMTCFMPVSFAGTKYDELSFEMEFQDGHYGNYYKFDDNKNPKFKLIIAYWKNDDIVKADYISSDAEISFSDANSESTDAALRYCGDNWFQIKGAKTKSETQYVIEYKGELADELTSKQVRLIVQSYSLKQSLRSLKFSNVKSTSKSSGNMITWNYSTSKANPDYVQIYRSSNKTKGYKAIGVVKGNEKAYLDDSNISKGKTYYYKLRGFSKLPERKLYSKYSGIVKCKAKTSLKSVTLKSMNKKMLKSYDLKLLSDAHIYGLPEDISWIDNPKSTNEYKNNMLYAFLIGNYEMNVAFPKNTSQNKLIRIANEMQELIGELSRTYPDLAGWYMNSHLKGDWQYEISYNKYGYPVIRVYLPAVDPDTILKERQAAIDEAVKYRNLLYAKGVLKESMTDMEKLQTYYRVLDNYAEVPQSDENYQVYYDTSYGYFVKKYCNCGGRASGITLLFHLEDILCAGVCCTDHITTMLRIDGVDYIIDIGNRVPLKTVDEALNYKGYGEFYTETIDYARAAFKLLM